MPDCRKEAIACYQDGDFTDPKLFLCARHAAENGYCALCGWYAAPEEGFKVERPFCDVCRQILEGL
jgi:hypothetical protein